jgi:hypothetical protein
MMLCPQCETLCGLVNLREDVVVAHYDTSLDLELSARSGCRLCQVMTRARREKSTDPDSSQQIRIKLIRDAGIELSLTTSSGQGLCPTSQADAKATVTYIIFEGYDLPSEFFSLRALDPNMDSK